MAEASMTGRCLCGAVSFTAKDVEPHVHACHCDMCRRWGGAPAFAVYAGSVDFSGEDSIGVYGSSEWAERGFCKTCGSCLFYRLREGGKPVMWAGVFDDPSPFSLEGEIYIDEKPAFYDFAGDRSRKTGEEFLKSIGMLPEDS